jgi:NADH:ubiquinone oxidoreductase subunit E
MSFGSICIGSSCHLKGSQRLVELFTEKIEKEKLDSQIVLSGSFCLGKCNREGVTLTVGDGINEEIITGVKPEEFKEFWNSQIAPKLENEV